MRVAHGLRALRFEVMGGPGDPTLTLASERRAQTFGERRASFERLFLIGCFAWPPFVIVDLLGAELGSLQRTIPSLLLARALGEVITVSLYAVIRWGNLTPRGLTVIDYVAFALAGFFLSAIGVEMGGLSSRNFAGIMLMVVARAALIPSHWLRAATAAGMTAVMWPLVMALAGLRIPEVAAQWHSPRALGDLLYGCLFILGTLGLCSAGSHMLWRARTQVARGSAGWARIASRCVSAAAATATSGSRGRTPCSATWPSRC